MYINYLKMYDDTNILHTPSIISTSIGHVEKTWGPSMTAYEILKVICASCVDIAYLWSDLQSHS